MPIPDAIAIIHQLESDTSTFTGASKQKWDHPLSYEAVLLITLANILIKVNSSKRNAKTIDYPFKDQSKNIRKGALLTPEEAYKLLKVFPKTEKKKKTKKELK